MNKTAGSESGKLWNTVGNSTTEDRRKAVREQVIGDILWSYVADKDENKFKGAIMDKSHCGLCILTLSPIRVGSALRIHGKGRVVTNATVIWCKKGSSDIYRSGLLLYE